MRIVFLCITVAFFLTSGCALKHEIQNFKEPLTPRYAELSLHNNELNSGKRIKIVSYNIKLCRNVDNAIELLRKNSGLKDADLLFLQEVCIKGVRKIAEELKYNYAYYPSYIHPAVNEDSGTAVLSKYPIDADIKVILPDYTKDKYYYKLQQTSAGIYFDIKGEKTAAFSVHLGVMISPELRKKQLDVILKAVPKGTKYIILAGDFNTYAQKHKEAIANHLKEYGFSCATEKVSWTYNYLYLLNKKQTLDYIFVKGFSDFNGDAVIDFNTSDHLPVWAQVKTAD